MRQKRVLPKRVLVQEENQPSIKTLLQNCSTHTKSDVLDLTGDADLEAKLIIDGKCYGIKDLDKLPLFEVSTKSNTDNLGFFGELCLFSNFHPVKFEHDEVTYHSSKQFIQNQRALFCNDHYI